MIRSSGCRLSNWQAADAEQLAKVVGQAGQQVLRFRERQPAQAEGGESPVFLQLAEDGFDDHLPPGIAAACRRLTQLEAHRTSRSTAVDDQDPPVLAWLEAPQPEWARRAGRRISVVAVLGRSSPGPRWSNLPLQARARRADPRIGVHVIAERLDREHRRRAGALGR